MKNFNALYKNSQSTESNAYSRYFVFFGVVHYVIQYSYIFSNKSTLNKTSLIIIYNRWQHNTTLSLSAMQDEANLYDVFNNDIGCQFFNNNLSLFPFGIHAIIPLLRVSVSSFLLK